MTATLQADLSTSTQPSTVIATCPSCAREWRPGDLAKVQVAETKGIGGFVSKRWTCTCSWKLKVTERDGMVRDLAKECASIAPSLKGSSDNFRAATEALTTNGSKRTVSIADCRAANNDAQSTLTRAVARLQSGAIGKLRGMSSGVGGKFDPDKAVSFVGELAATIADFDREVQSTSQDEFAQEIFISALTEIFVAVRDSLRAAGGAIP
jgi:hypothetical protein